MIIDKEQKFRRLCMEKLPRMIGNIGKRDVAIWGASKGGEIAKECIETFGINVYAFIDKRYEEIKEFRGKKVISPQALKNSNIYVVIGLMSFVYEIEEVLSRAGYKHTDYIYIYDNEGYNKKDIIYKNCKIGRYTYGYEGLLEYFPLLN